MVLVLVLEKKKEMHYAWARRRLWTMLRLLSTFSSSRLCWVLGMAQTLIVQTASVSNMTNQISNFALTSPSVKGLSSLFLCSTSLSLEDSEDDTSYGQLPIDVFN